MLASFTKCVSFLVMRVPIHNLRARTGDRHRAAHSNDRVGDLLFRWRRPMKKEAGPTGPANQFCARGQNLYQP